MGKHTASIGFAAAVVLVATLGACQRRAPTPGPMNQGSENTPPGVSTDCLNTATEKFKTCTDACKGRSDAMSCCGDCDSEFATTFQNCCNDKCKVDNPPPSCSDNSGPGCAGGVVTPAVARPDWCPEL